jgi:hypothetical protein
MNEYESDINVAPVVLHLKDAENELPGLSD